MYRIRFSRLGCWFLMLLTTLIVAVHDAGAGAKPAERLAAQEAMPRGLAGLSIAAQASISGALGRDQRAYHAKREDQTWRMENPRHGLYAEFTASGVAVQSGTALFAPNLYGVGRGARLETVPTGKPEAKSNRIEYRRGAFSEWYVNGPFGLQQGFTLDTPPPRKAGEALTVALRLSGDLSAVIDPGGDGVALQTRGGATALRYRGLVAWDSSGRTLPVWWQGQDREIRLRVDDTGARYPLTIDPFIEQAKLTASDGEADDGFGISVAVSGDTVVVGADRDNVETDPLSELQGSAYVFVEPPGGWAGALVESAKLTASDGVLLDLFGFSVAVSSDTVVVGLGGNLRPAYLFVRPPGGWAGALNETARLAASDGREEDRFGASVAVSGDTVVVGAPGAEIGARPNQGSAYVFVEPPGGWAGALVESAKLSASDGAAADSFGSSVAVSGDTAVAGAPGPSGVNARPGSAYVFVEPLGGWVGTPAASAKLTASDGAAADRFGSSVTVGGDTVVAGAPGATIGANARQGSAYVFVEPPGGWVGALVASAKLTASDGAAGDNLGASVAVSGDTVVAAARGATIGANARQGAAYVFVEPRGGWAGALVESAKLIASGGAAEDFFGSSVAVSGETVVAGALALNLLEDANGSAYVFNTAAFPPSPPTPPSPPGSNDSPLVAPIANTPIRCQDRRCRVRLRCPLEATTPCSNQIDLFVRASAARFGVAARVKARGEVRFARGVADVSPGETKTVNLKPTPGGRRIIRTSKKRRLKGVMEIKNLAGTAFNRLPVRIKLPVR